MIRTLAAAGLCLCLSLCTAVAQSYPQDVDFYVNDYADLLDDTQEEALRNTLDELYQERDIEFTVLTINRMSDYGHNGSIESFATGLFNTWGIGDANRNDGLLLFVSRFDRELRIEVGSGYGDSLNAPMKRIIDNKIVPYFRLDDYAEGIRIGVDEVIYEVTGRFPGEYNSTGLERTWNGFGRFLTALGAWILLPFTLLIPVGVRLYRRIQRNRPRVCPNDGTRMRRYLEEKEDAHLSSGQQVEEDLKSVDYDVWYCDNCDHVIVEGYRAWFSRYTICRDCKSRTARGTSRVITPATRSSSGQRETNYVCNHCNARYSVFSVIPRVTSSSGSGGRGGGRSSGGGASGSW